MHDLSKTFYRITSAAGLFFTASRNSACKDSPVAMGKEVHLTELQQIDSFYTDTPCWLQLCDELVGQVGSSHGVLEVVVGALLERVR